MDHLHLRNATADDAEPLAELIYASTNAWYHQHLGHAVFTCLPRDLRLFVETYETLDPGRCLVVEDNSAGRLAGSCFVHPRPTHVSLGILNVADAYAGRGVARRLVRAVTDQADALGLPTRLVSSAMNLDSYSLYSRAGFVPYAFFQDVLIEAPRTAPMIDDPEAQSARVRVRHAVADDDSGMAALERGGLGIERTDDLAYFINDANDHWHTLVIEDKHGVVNGYLASVNHPACQIIGPGYCTDEASLIALLAAQLTHHAGQTMLVVAPADRQRLIRQLYRWGGRNVETHVAQCRPTRGDGIPPRVQGVMLPTFLPETA